MKQRIALLLALSMLLSLAACGSVPEVEEPPAAVQTTEPPTAAPTEEPEEPAPTYTAYTLSVGERYMDAVQAMGFWELDMGLCTDEAQVNHVEGAQNAQATPVSLEVTEPASTWRLTTLAWLITSTRRIQRHSR